MTPYKGGKEGMLFKSGRVEEETVFPQKPA